MSQYLVIPSTLWIFYWVFGINTFEIEIFFICITIMTFLFLLPSRFSSRWFFSSSYFIGTTFSFFFNLVIVIIMIFCYDFISILFISKFVNSIILMTAILTGIFLCLWDPSSRQSFLLPINEVVISGSFDSPTIYNQSCTYI